MCAAVDAGAGLGRQDQDRWLSDAKAAVKQQAFYMRKAIDEDNMRDVFKYSSAMLSELRTNLLSPQKYYELYMRTFDEMRRLEMFFEDQTSKGHSAAELYERVQHAGNILPRLYLLLTVAAVYMRSSETPPKAVLKDTVEMCGGIQHPIRGLFLRSYLTQISRQGVMAIESSEEGSVDDAVEFLLHNFTEMNKLWVRMQHQGPARERSKRERERQELRDLVAKNLVMLSQLDGVNEEMYGEVVLPRILEQVISCKDELAQNYLMDCVIQVFPDEFHIKNLDKFLEACSQLNLSTNVANILCGLVNRLSRFAQADPANVAYFEEQNAFEKLTAPINQVVAGLDQSSVASIYLALLNFTVSMKYETLDRVDDILAKCAQALEPSKPIKASAAKHLVGLLTTPLSAYPITQLLELGSYPGVMALLNAESRRQVAVSLVQKILKHGTLISSPDKVHSLFDFVSLLIEDPDQEGLDLDDEDIAEEQNLVARLVHQFRCDDPAANLALLEVAKDKAVKGGPRRCECVLPSIVFDVLLLTKRCEGQEAQRPMFQFLQHTIDHIAEIPLPEVALQLYLECALVADACSLEDNAYEFMTAAFDVYENGIPDTKAQVEALAVFVGVLNECHSFGEDNLDTLVTTTTKWSVKLLKKSDQCRAVCSCSHLFWRGKVNAGEEGVALGDKVLVCLKKALTIAQQAKGMAKSSRGDCGPVELFVGILNKYLYFFEKQSEQSAVVSAEDVQNLLDLVSNETSSLSSDREGHEATLRYYHNTLKHIMIMKDKMPAKYSSISLNKT